MSNRWRIMQNSKASRLLVRYRPEGVRAGATKSVAEARISCSFANKQDRVGHDSAYDTLVSGIPHEVTIGCPTRFTRAFV